MANERGSSGKPSVCPANPSGSFVEVSWTEVSWTDGECVTARRQKLSIIQALLLLVIPAMASWRPFGAAIAKVRQAPR